MGSIDPRWAQVLNGLPVLAFIEWNAPGVLAEVTGVDDRGYVWLVVDGEEEPRRVFWANVRPAGR